MKKIIILLLALLPYIAFTQCEANFTFTWVSPTAVLVECDQNIGDIIGYYGNDSIKIEFGGPPVDSFLLEFNGVEWDKVCAKSGCTDTCTTNLVLPVELIEFTVEERAAYTVIKWTVENEDVHGYVLERSTDSRTFEAINYVSAANEGSARYQLIDDQIFNGLTLYRLSIMEHDGSKEYSNTIGIRRYLGNGLVIKDIGEVKYILSDTPFLYSVYTTYGDLLLRGGTLSTSQRVDMSDLPPAIYLIRFEYWDKSSQVIKIQR